MAFEIVSPKSVELLMVCIIYNLKSNWDGEQFDQGSLALYHLDIQTTFSVFVDESHGRVRVPDEPVWFCDSSLSAELFSKWWRLCSNVECVRVGVQESPLLKLESVLTGLFTEHLNLFILGCAVSNSVSEITILSSISIRVRYVHFHKNLLEKGTKQFIFHSAVE